MGCLGEAGDGAAAIREAEAYEARMTELWPTRTGDRGLADRLRRTAVEDRGSVGRDSPRPGTIPPDDRTAGRAATAPGGMVGRLPWTEARADRRRGGHWKVPPAAGLVPWRALAAPSREQRSYAAEGRLPYALVADWLRSGAIFSGLTEPEPGCPRSRATAPRGSGEPSTPRACATHGALAAPDAFRGPGVARSSMGLTMFLIDDLQPTEPDTVEWLDYLLRYDEATPFSWSARADGRDAPGPPPAPPPS